MNLQELLKGSWQVEGSTKHRIVWRYQNSSLCVGQSGDTTTLYFDDVEIVSGTFEKVRNRVHRLASLFVSQVAPLVPSDALGVRPVRHYRCS